MDQLSRLDFLLDSQLLHAPEEDHRADPVPVRHSTPLSTMNHRDLDFEADTPSTIYPCSQLRPPRAPPRDELDFDNLSDAQPAPAAQPLLLPPLPVKKKIAKKDRAAAQKRAAAGTKPGKENRAPAQPAQSAKPKKGAERPPAYTDNVKTPTPSKSSTNTQPQPAKRPPKSAGNVGEMSYYQTVSNSTKIYDSGPLIGWHLYFPLASYTEDDPNLTLIDQGISLFKKYQDAWIDIERLKTTYSLGIDLKFEDPESGKKVFSESVFIDTLEAHPSSLIESLGLALHQVIAATPAYAAYKIDLTKKFYVRFLNYTRATSYAEIKSAKIGKFVGLRGTVIRLGAIKPLITQMAFTCSMCKDSQTIFFADGIFRRPYRCENTDCINYTMTTQEMSKKPINGALAFIPERNSSDTKSVDSQIVRIQELVRDDIGPLYDQHEDHGEPSSSNNRSSPSRAFTGVSEGEALTPPPYGSAQSYHQAAGQSALGLNKEASSAHTSSSSQGRIPRYIDCELTEDLIECCTPGMVVTLTGEVKVFSNLGDHTGVGGGGGAKKTGLSSRKKSANAYIFQTYIHVNAISILGGGEGKSELVSTFDLHDLYAIRSIATSTKLFRRVINSIGPSICGHELVKAGLALALFGADQKFTDDKNRVPIRGDSHVLMVGDPGLGKTQLLKSVSEIAPRSVYVSGNSATAAGLTVAITRDASSGDGSGDYSLEAGALVLSDKGICCIDEFDKLAGSRSGGPSASSGNAGGGSGSSSSGGPTGPGAHIYQALLEAMEQQVISVAKAGIVCSLPCRASIIAAGNPVGGHYNRNFTISENLRLSPALLSRFDLIFILLDKPNERDDYLLSEKVMAVYMGKKKTANLNTPYCRYTTPGPNSSCAALSSSFNNASFTDRKNGPRQNDPSTTDYSFMFNDDTPSMGDLDGAAGVIRGRGHTNNNGGGGGGIDDMDEPYHEQRPLLERLRIPMGEDFVAIAAPLLKKYIEYARRYVHPKLSAEASFVIKEFYLALRQKQYATDMTPVTTRQLESMIRLCEARARVELRETVSETDAFDVIEIFKASLMQVTKGQAAGEPGCDSQAFLPSQRGPKPAKQLKGAKGLHEALQIEARKKSNALFTYQEIRDVASHHHISDNIETLIDRLNLQGFILKKGGRLFQLK